ncbi:hypothetical protein [Pontibacter rugosus]|uniref:Uncharacterized protein n=1 Tax=Pontibacter rugosus TaxID=1745966 RepID=A0ABW3SL12_9BACT
MEQIERHDYKREGRRFADFWGTNEHGEVMLWTDHIDPSPGMVTKGQPVREHPDEVRIKFRTDDQGRGVLHSIESTFGIVLLGNDGTVVSATAYGGSGFANDQDKREFINKFKAIIASIFNFRSRMREGHNYLPPFMLDVNDNPTPVPEAYYEAGVEINGVVYNTLSAPTNNYATHNTDGTPINPSTDAEATV